MQKLKQASADERAILDVEHRRRVALVAVDLAELDRLFDEDLIHIHSTGLVHTKAELLRHIDQKRAFIGIERGSLQVRVEGNIAVITGAMTNRMRAQKSEGEVLMRGFVTQVLRRTADGWKFLNVQLTPIREQ